MRCPECKGSLSIANFFKEKECPACGAALKRMPTKEQLKETLISFAEDKGYIFWALVYILVVWTIAFFDQILGGGGLFDYISDHGFRFFFLAFWSGSIIDYYAKANVEVTAVRNKFIFRPPIYLRRFRFWTNVAAMAGIGLSIYLLNRWPGYITPLPMVTFVTTFLLCLVWAIMGIMVSEDDMKDKRIVYFLREMRVERTKRYNRGGAIYIGGLFLAGITFYKLIHISGLWWYISNARIVYNLITFFNNYFAWVHQFTD